MRGLLPGIAAALVAAPALCADPIPDFRLRDENFNSVRGGQMVSPRDYKMQISAFFFGEADCGSCRTQFGHLNTMQNDLRAANPDLNIEIVGVNHPDHRANNSQMITGRQLPWLQDTAETHVWQSLNVGLRDLWVLDARNQVITNFSLFEGTNSLSYIENRGELRQILLKAAKSVDSDSDQLEDAWEQEHFGNLHQTAGADFDRDGASNFDEMAFGTDPKEAASKPEIFRAMLPDQTFTFSFRRSTGSRITYLTEISPDLSEWSGSGFAIQGAARNLFDGTGMSEVIATLSDPASVKRMQFVRIRAVPRGP